MTLGAGPAYPVMGMPAPPPSPAGVVDLRDDLHEAGWYWHKTLWAVSSRYRGPVLVRGREVGGPTAIHFGSEGNELVELVMPPEREAGWRYFVTDTLLRGTGCYAFQVDGTTFSTVIVFEATRR